jgi:hypothetical protein
MTNHRIIRAIKTAGRNAPAPVRMAAVSLKIQAAYGRLYITGPSVGKLRTIPGAAWNEKKEALELSLTMESFRTILRVTGCTKEAMWSFCTPAVQAWAKAARSSEIAIARLHAKMDTGWRADLPWVDNRADTPVGPHERFKADQVYVDAKGVRRWKYRVAFEHQKVMATVSCELDGTAYLCQAGTGKTRAACETIGEKLRKGEIDVAVVVAPKRPCAVWQRELPVWLERGSVTIVRLDGSLKEREATIDAMTAADRGTVLILNYEGLAPQTEGEEAKRKRDEKHAELCVKAGKPVTPAPPKKMPNVLAALVRLAGRMKLGFVPDEMHRVSNPNAKTTKAAMELARHCVMRLGLTGTPIRNDAYDVWSEWYIIDLGIEFGANYVQFKRENFRELAWDPYNVEPLEGALDSIGTRLRKRGLRYRKEDCFDLPPKLYEVVPVEMGPEQTRAYREMEEYLIAMLRREDETGRTEDGNIATAATQLTAILRLSQITSGFVKTAAGTIHRFPTQPKLDVLEEILRDSLRDSQEIAWAVYRPDHDVIIERLSSTFRIGLIRGQIPERGPQSADEIEAAFLRGDLDLIVGQQAAAGIGLNLQSASAASYYSQGYSFIDRDQSEDRCHRSGSEQHRERGHILYRDIVVPGTVDDVIMEAVQGKKELSAVVVDLKNLLGV